MSCDERKVALRGRIPELDGLSDKEVYEYFKEKIGPADEVDDDWFYYERTHALRPCQSLNDGTWGAEFVFAWHRSSIDDEYYGATKVSDEAMAVARVYLMDIGVDPDTICLHSYVYYNGGDEPVEF